MGNKFEEGRKDGRAAELPLDGCELDPSDDDEYRAGFVLGVADAVQANTPAPYRDQLLGLLAYDLSVPKAALKQYANIQNWDEFENGYDGAKNGDEYGDDDDDNEGQDDEEDFGDDDDLDAVRRL